VIRYLIRTAYIWLLFNSVSGLPCLGQEITFTFNPPDGISYVEDLKTNKKIKIDKLDQNAIQETGKLISIVRNSDKYTVTLKPVSDSFTSNGQPVNDPIHSATKNIVNQYFIDTNGVFMDFTGFEEFIDSLTEIMSPRLMNSLTKNFTKDNVKEIHLALWNSRIGNYVNKSVSIGDYWIGIDSTMIAPNTYIKFYSVSKFNKIVQLNEKKCVEILLYENSDLNKISNLLKAKKSDLKKRPNLLNDLDSGNGEVSGDGMRVIDPSTMLIYAEKTHRQIKAKIRIGADEGTKYDLIEDAEYNYKY
jgi:hypothetical protein